jgi:hypothetical protein
VLADHAGYRPSLLFIGTPDLTHCCEAASPRDGKVAWCSPKGSLLLVLRRWVFGFKLISVRIKNEGGIVVGSVMQSEAGSTLVNAAEF